MPELLSAHVSRYLRNRGDLERRLPPALLVFTPALAGERVEEQEEYRLKTVTNAGPPTLGATEPVVFSVLKSQTNAFGRGVTVGRTGNNDVVLDDSSVSRFHAWLARDESQAKFLLTDAGSKNGSWLGGVRLTPRKAVSVEDGVRMRFGQVELVFYTPSGFVRMLAARMAP
ncbi:FHA domain-containing protein [Myxococcus stipitatus DSM 14675]|uniref:FHA domain-containing protein n=1 Tax=Myxococcus stipitatus (strain DSM 14675 / JCM 12634 / Mx s8) TaxID=1278073 RepID=L7UB98_MYXSD|nr:FHA domain-containing protein [Myxococcus stipitatus]AGC46176.1 FHA domain-containing protein [Myxococcus stipitatus DSM 14675]